MLDDNAAFCNKCGAKIDSAPGAPGTPGGGPTPPPYGSGFGANFPPAASGGLSSNEAIFNMGILIAGILVMVGAPGIIALPIGVALIIGFLFAMKGRQKTA